MNNKHAFSDDVNTDEEDDEIEQEADSTSEFYDPQSLVSINMNAINTNNNNNNATSNSIFNTAAHAATVSNSSNLLQVQQQEPLVDSGFFRDDNVSMQQQQQQPVQQQLPAIIAVDSEEIDLKLQNPAQQQQQQQQQPYSALYPTLSGYSASSTSKSVAATSCNSLTPIVVQLSTLNAPSQFSLQDYVTANLPKCTSLFVFHTS